MALSNILREPRREITESVVGLGVVVVVVGADYGATMALGLGAADWPRTLAAMAVLPAMVVIATVFVFLVMHLTHALGERICNALQRRGVHLRPRQRPKGCRG